MTTPRDTPPPDESPADGSPRERPDLHAAVEVLRLLADETRLAILELLTDQELAVTAIATALGRPVPAVSQHLARLRAGHLVVTRRVGTSVLYRQANEHVAALVRNTVQQAEHVLSDDPPHHRGPDPRG